MCLTYIHIPTQYNSVSLSLAVRRVMLQTAFNFKKLIYLEKDLAVQL